MEGIEKKRRYAVPGCHICGSFPKRYHDSVSPGIHAERILSSPSAVFSGRMILLPVDITLDGYRYIVQYNEIWIGYANTFFYTIVGTLLNLLVTIPVRMRCRIGICMGGM
ncbi:MAG: hypothetical protein ACLR23_10040 [Clostridia bacterium]